MQNQKKNEIHAWSFNQVPLSYYISFIYMIYCQIVSSVFQEQNPWKQTKSDLIIKSEETETNNDKKKEMKTNFLSCILILAV
jgi:hypothetical protein